MNFILDLFSIPVAYAQADKLDKFIGNVNRLIINPLISLLFALAVLFFLYGVLQFFLNSENEEKRTESKSHMLWGIVGITIMMGVWTILGFMLNTFNISTSEINPEEGKVDLKPYNPPSVIR